MGFKYFICLISPVRVIDFSESSVNATLLNSQIRVFSIFFCNGTMKCLIFIIWVCKSFCSHPVCLLHSFLQWFLLSQKLFLLDFCSMFCLLFCELCWFQCSFCFLVLVGDDFLGRHFLIWNSFPIILDELNSKILQVFTSIDNIQIICSIFNGKINKHFNIAGKTRRLTNSKTSVRHDFKFL